MNNHIADLSFDDGMANLKVCGRTPAESKLHTQKVVAAIKEAYPDALFKTPAYEGFERRFSRHIYRLTVIGGPPCGDMETLLRSLV